MLPILGIMIVLLVIAGYFLYNRFGGFPVGYNKGKILIYQSFCSDVCPDATRWDVKYYGITTKEECEVFAGKPLYDFAWGGFIGCAPNF